MPSRVNATDTLWLLKYLALINIDRDPAETEAHRFYVF